MKEVGELAKILSMINAWDRRKVDEPDFLARLNGFKAARLEFEKNLDSDFLLVYGLSIINNCCFFIRNVSYFVGCFSFYF